MKEWLENQLRNLELSEESRFYLLGRGAEPQSFTKMNVVTWRTAEAPAPCKDFQKQFGTHGQRMDGYLVFPLYSMRSQLIGFITRSMENKFYSKYLMGLDYNWNPVLLGLHRALPKIWNGGDLWIVEGIFDLFAMEHVIPPKDGIVAAGRAMLTWQHYDFLRRFNIYVNLVFDMDAAGRNGASKVMYNLNLHSIRGRNINYIGGKDPGEIWDQSGEMGLKDAFIF